VDLLEPMSQDKKRDKVVPQLLSSV